MRVPNRTKAFLGYQKGDRVILDHWKMLQGGMPGTVSRILKHSLEVTLDNGDLCKVAGERDAEWVGIRRMENGGESRGEFPW